MTIAILCPTRGRPEQFTKMCRSTWQTSKHVKHIYTAISEQDCKEYGMNPTPYGMIFTPDDMPTACKWNLLAEMAMKDPEITHFMLGADDMVFSTPCWDDALLKLYDKKPHVYSLLDSRDPDGTPHPIVTREYIEAMGYFLPPIFLHWYVDSWTVDIAKANNCFTHLRDYLLIHDKPSDKGQGDETHNRIRMNGWRERDAYVNQTCQHYLALEKSRLKMHMLHPEEEVMKGLSAR